MAIVGAGWETENKEGKKYISIKFDDDLLPMTIDSTKRFSLKRCEKKSENAPDFRLEMYVLKQKEENMKENIDEFI